MPVRAERRLPVDGVTVGQRPTRLPGCGTCLDLCLRRPMHHKRHLLDFSCMRPVLRRMRTKTGYSRFNPRAALFGQSHPVLCPAPESIAASRAVAVPGCLRSPKEQPASRRCSVNEVTVTESLLRRSVTSPSLVLHGLFPLQDLLSGPLALRPRRPPILRWGSRCPVFTGSAVGLAKTTCGVRTIPSDFLPYSRPLPRVRHWWNVPTFAEKSSLLRIDRSDPTGSEPLPVQVVHRPFVGPSPPCGGRGRGEGVRTSVRTGVRSVVSLPGLASGVDRHRCRFTAVAGGGEAVSGRSSWGL